MAKTRGVWGIDIGVSALKALRCHIDDEGNVVADSYDFIEYPKALSLPDADEESLVNEALDEIETHKDFKDKAWTHRLKGDLLLLQDLPADQQGVVQREAEAWAVVTDLFSLGWRTIDTVWDNDG